MSVVVVVVTFIQAFVDVEFLLVCRSELPLRCCLCAKSPPFSCLDRTIGKFEKYSCDLLSSELNGIVGRGMPKSLQSIRAHETRSTDRTVKNRVDPKPRVWDIRKMARKFIRNSLFSWREYVSVSRMEGHAVDDIGRRQVAFQPLC
jgi:hypothetical protein